MSSSAAPAVVLGAYLLLLLWIGVAGYRRSRGNEDDYYLAGRNQGTLVTTLTLMATMFSSAALLGIPGLVYRDGVCFMLFALNLPLSGAAVFVLGGRIRRIGRKRGYVTPADLVADYYGSHSMRLLTALVGFLYVLPYVVMQMQAGGYLAQRMFPDAPPLELLGFRLTVFDVGTTVLSLVTTAYVLVGGMRSVAWSDVVQGAVLLGGMLLAGLATIVAMGGVRGYFEQVSALPREALSIPGATGAYPATRLWTIVLFASLATMIQTGQWMRYYSARSSAVLRRSALVFAAVLPACFLFGIMLVALGARALHPPSVVRGVIPGGVAAGVVPHPTIGELDQVVLVMVQEHVPALLGPLGPWAVALLFVAVLAASMSTADSGLHALSAVLTRDVYDRYVRPGASERERGWFGRGVVVVASLVALALVAFGRHDPDFAPLALIAELMFVAIAFSCQLLPVTIDVLFVGRGTKRGAACGVVAGLVTVFLFTPFPGMVAGELAGVDRWTSELRRMFDVGFVGLVVNVAVFGVVSRVTPKLDRRHVERFRADMKSGA